MKKEMKLVLFFYLHFHPLAWDYNKQPNFQVIKNLATTQVRNVASLGGTLLWDHPGSDMIPLLLAAGASVVIVTENDEHIVPLEAEFIM